MAAGGTRKRSADLGAAIEVAALAMFAEHGYDNVTIDEIAAAVGVHQRTIPRYFPSKEDLLLAYARRSSRLICEELALRPASESPTEATHQAYVLGIPADSRAQLSPLWAKAAATCPSALVTVTAEHMQAFSLAMTERLERTMPLDGAKALSAAIAGVLHGLWRQWVDDGGEGEFADVVRIGLERFDSVMVTRSDEAMREIERLRDENHALRVERDLFRAAAAKLLEDAKGDGEPQPPPANPRGRRKGKMSETGKRVAVTGAKPG